jgi:uncharacterized membrane protein
MKHSWRTDLPAIAIVLAMWALAAASWSVIPERVPVHWNLQGQADRWGGRGEALLLLPAIATAVYALFPLLPRLDPGRANYAKFQDAFFAMRFAVVALLGAIFTSMVITYRGGGAAAPRALMLPAAGVVLIVIGNLMGKLRPNWFIGVRTPWTLSSKTSWTRSHRVGGWVFIAAGALFVLAGFLRAPWGLGVALGALAAGSLGVVVYSYFVWRSDPDKIPPAGTTPANDV